MNNFFSQKNLIKHLIPNVGTVVVVALMLFTYSAFAAPNYQVVLSTFPYQGTLTDAGGTPIDGNIDMVFSLYDVASGGSPLWQEAHTGGNAVPVSNGLFQVMLGSLTPIPDIWDSGIIYLGIKVGNDTEMSPREIVGSVPTALNAYSANTANLADQALNVSDGSITNAKLNLQGDLDLGTSANSATITASYPNLNFTNTGESLRFLSDGNIFMFIDQDNNNTTNSFRIYSDVNSAVTANRILMLEETGDLYIKGSLTSNAYIEGNLQTIEERNSEKIERFLLGDVLCWNVDLKSLEKCETTASPLMVAVADENGKPIILGAETVKVLGPVNIGDLLVSSDTPGYAIAWWQVGEGTPPTGIVIGKALEGTTKETDLLKMLIK